ncbi:MAG TPA: DUF6089 family protein [Bacteroidia bacterium]
MVRKLILIIILLPLSAIFISAPIWAQKNEVGIHAGVTYYHGELNPITPFDDPFVGFGLFYRRNFNGHFGVRASALATQLWNTDKNGVNDYQTFRNQSFRTNLLEASVMGEINFFWYEPGAVKKNVSRWTPFIFGGVGGFYFQPQAKYNGAWVNLHNLGTEGQGIVPGRKPYKRIQPVIPFGLGIKATPFRGFIITIDWGMRMTFTDYLDDVSTTYVDPAILNQIGGKPAIEIADQSPGSSVSNIDRQRGFARTKDWYGYLGVHLSIRIKDKRNDCWTGNKSVSKFRK